MKEKTKKTFFNKIKETGICLLAAGLCLSFSYPVSAAEKRTYDYSIQALKNAGLKLNIDNSILTRKNLSQILYYSAGKKLGNQKGDPADYLNLLYSNEKIDFLPASNEITRGELSMILWELSGKPDPDKVPTVSEEEEKFDFIDLDAYAADRMNDAAITESETAEGETAADNTSGTTEAAVTDTADSAVIDASNSIASSADTAGSAEKWLEKIKSSVRFMVRKGIMKGYTNQIFRPEGRCTILQAAYGADLLFHEGMRASDLTPDQLVSAVAAVQEYARTHGYRYGHSSSTPPCADGKISCDRLEARALWDLGFTDQPAGGITILNMDGYLLSKGFVKSTDFNDAGYGSIILLGRAGNGTPVHAYTMVSCSPASGSRVCYDTGSNQLIHQVQPVTLPLYKDGRILLGVYNIPR